MLIRLVAVGLALGALVAQPARAQRAPLLCHSAKATLYAPQYNGAGTVWLDDTAGVADVAADPNEVPGGPSSVAVRKVRDLCLPAGVDGRSPVDAESHWVLYDTKGLKRVCANDPALACDSDAACAGVGGACVDAAKFDKKDPRNLSVRVVDAYNDTRLNLGKEVALLAPASFDPSAPQGAPPSDQHYKCYAVKQGKAACAGGENAGESCRSAGDCPLSTCVPIAGFPKATHPEGLFTSLETYFTDVLDVGDPERPFALGKLAYYCQASDVQLAGEAAVPSSAPAAGLLCYTAKPQKFACHLGDNDNQPCSSDSDCGTGLGVSCRFESKFDSKDSRTRGMFVGDTFFDHELDVRKEDLFCTPACKEPPAAPAFGENVLRVNDLQLATSGHAFFPLASIANGAIDDQVGSGSINLLLELDSFGDGSMSVNGYVGSLDPSNPGCAVGNPAAFCSYLVDADSFDPNSLRIDTSCGEHALIHLPVRISGTDTLGPAAVVGEGTGSFDFSFPFTSTVTIALSVTQVQIAGNLTHSGGKFTALNGGQLSGAVVHRQFKQTVNELPQGLCQGGGNNNEPCALSDSLCTGGGVCSPNNGRCLGGSNDGTQCGSDASCPDPRGGNPSDACNETYIGGFTPAQVAGLIDQVPRDLDLDGLKTCEGATNDGRVCTSISDCPDQEGSLGATCDQFESSSILFELSAIDAAISGVAP